MKNWTRLTKENEPKGDGYYWVKATAHHKPIIVERYGGAWYFIGSSNKIYILRDAFDYICLAPIDTAPFDVDLTLEEIRVEIDKLRTAIVRLKELMIDD